MSGQVGFGIDDAPTNSRFQSCLTRHVCEPPRRQKRDDNIFVREVICIAEALLWSMVFFGKLSVAAERNRSVLLPIRCYR